LTIRVFCFLLFVLLITVTAAAASFADTAASGPARSAINDFAGQIISDGKIGRVGIGTTQPAAAVAAHPGEMIVGSSGAVCTPAIEGAIRYADKRLQFCNGAGWRNVSLDKTQ
jgi:hypothetical protein